MLRRFVFAPAARSEPRALRNGDGELDADELVRASLTGPKLAAVPTAQTVRLAAAVEADRETEDHQLDQLTVELRATATADTDRTVQGRRVPPAQIQAQQNLRVRTLATRIRQIRTARRTRNGWGVAA